MSAHSVEDIKRASAGLRGTLLASLADAVTGTVADGGLIAELARWFPAVPRPSALPG